MPLSSPARRLGLDVTIAVGLGGLLVWELGSEDGALTADSTILQVAFGLGMALALLGRRRFPVETMLVVGALFAAPTVVLGRSAEVLTEGVMMLVAAYSVAAFARRPWSWIGLLVALGAGYVRAFGDPTLDPGSAVIDALWVVPAWGIGYVVHHHDRRADAAALRAANAAQAERLRIAREMHDVVAHGLGVMVLHARGGRRILDTDAEAAREAFDTITEKGEQALEEMRRLLGVLRVGEDAEHPPDLTPAPGIDELPRLVRGFQEAGLPCTLALDDVGQLPPGLELCVYRIVQESLTNSLRHGGQSASVSLRRMGRELHLEVQDRGGGPDQGPGSGQGLHGIRERVELYGGSVTTGRGDGGFRVSARIPVQQDHLATGGV